MKMKIFVFISNAHIEAQFHTSQTIGLSSIRIGILVVEFHTFFRVRMANILPYEIGHSLGVLLTYRGENTQQDWESIIGKHIR